MATTKLRFMGWPGGDEEDAVLTSIGGTGTPAEAYTIAAITTRVYEITITEALVGRFELLAGDGGAIATGVVTLADEATTIDATLTTDWTETERQQIRYRLGLDGDKDTPEAQASITVTARANGIVRIDFENPTNAAQLNLTQLTDYANDDEVFPIGPIRVQTAKPLLRESNPPSLRFGASYQIRKGAYADKTDPRKHIQGTAYAESVEGEPEQYDLYIEIDKDELDKDPGTYGWDIEAVFADGDITHLIRGSLKLWESMGNIEER
ncbi:hypothetical protein [Rhodopirellula halodulae]|uniref:hypothetical protein n=1 Tax=Rhodopirellula halodulae TaxID=2894198 RepID=UPI001E4DB489|nr:hypothetical protein [Rhodopirellula sp. JC737]MCC9655300.1 hypothetical protein [Rhodopirellula sp. JC737]